MADGIAILGHYGGWNTGDEAILVSLSNELHAREPAIKIDAVSRRFGPIGIEVCQAADVEPVPLLSWRCLRSLTRRRLVIGGGQMLSGDGSPAGLVILVVAATLNRLAGGRPVIAFVGVHHVRSRLTRFLAMTLCRVVTHVSVRDAASLSELTACGVPASRVTLSADIVLGGSLGTSTDTRVRGDGPIVVVGHRSPHRRLIAIQDLIDLISACQRLGGGREVIVASHDGRDAFDDGLEADLAEVLGGDPDSRFQRFDSFEEQLALYQRASVVISVRMHPLILASVFGVPAVAVRGSQKVASLAAELELPMIDAGADATSIIDAIGGHPGAPPLTRFRESIDRDIEAVLER